MCNGVTGWLIMGIEKPGKLWRSWVRLEIRNEILVHRYTEQHKVETLKINLDSGNTFLRSLEYVV